MKFIKQIIKKHFYWLWLKEQYSPTTQIALRNLQLQLRIQPHKNYLDNQFNIFTYHGEDGLLFGIISLLENIPPLFIDIGAGNCVKSNCSNLAVNLAWHGLFIDGNKSNIVIGQQFYNKVLYTRAYPPLFEAAFVTPKNINELIKKQNISGDIGLLSIDIDGNDYWIWQALTIVKPWVVIIESKIEFGLHDIVMPYTEKNNNQLNNKYTGASIVAMQKLAKQKGYRLVSANRYGYNLIFIKEELLADAIPTINVEKIVEHSSCSECFYPAEELKDFL